MMTLHETIKARYNSGKKFELLKASDFENCDNNVTLFDYKLTVDAIKIAIDKGATKEVLKRKIAYTCDLIGATDIDVDNVLSLLSMSLCKGAQGLDEDSKDYIKTNYNVVIKALEESIHSGAIYRTDEGAIIDSLEMKNELLKRTMDAKKKYLKESAHYNVLTFKVVSEDTFRKYFECAIAGAKKSATISKYDKELAKLNRRLDNGKITQDKYDLYVERLNKAYK